MVEWAGLQGRALLSACTMLAAASSPATAGLLNSGWVHVKTKGSFTNMNVGPTASAS